MLLPAYIFAVAPRCPWSKPTLVTSLSQILLGLSRPTVVFPLPFQGPVDLDASHPTLCALWSLRSPLSPVPCSIFLTGELRQLPLQARLGSQATGPSWSLGK